MLQTIVILLDKKKPKNKKVSSNLKSHPKILFSSKPQPKIWRNVLSIPFLFNDNGYSTEIFLSNGKFKLKSNFVTYWILKTKESIDFAFECEGEYTEDQNGKVILHDSTLVTYHSSKFDGFEHYGIKTQKNSKFGEWIFQKKLENNGKHSLTLVQAPSEYPFSFPVYYEN